MIVGQGPTALAVGAGVGCLDIFTLIYLFSPLSPSLREMARYRLKYCLKGPLNPKQPTNHGQNVFCAFRLGLIVNTSKFMIPVNHEFESFISGMSGITESNFMSRTVNPYRPL